MQSSNVVVQISRNLCIRNKNYILGVEESAKNNCCPVPLWPRAELVSNNFQINADSLCAIYQCQAWVSFPFTVWSMYAFTALFFMISAFPLKLDPFKKISMGWFAVKKYGFFQVSICFWLAPIALSHVCKCEAETLANIAILYVFSCYSKLLLVESCLCMTKQKKWNTIEKKKLAKKEESLAHICLKISVLSGGLRQIAPFGVMGADYWK